MSNDKMGGPAQSGSARVYYDQYGNCRSLLWMVRNEPEWAASRITEGEKAAERERALVAAAFTLLQASMTYRSVYELRGHSHIATERAWDEVRKAQEKVSEALAQHESKESSDDQ